MTPTPTLRHLWTLQKLRWMGRVIPGSGVSDYLWFPLLSQSAGGKTPFLTRAQPQQEGGGRLTGGCLGQTKL